MLKLIDCFDQMKDFLTLHKKFNKYLTKFYISVLQESWRKT